jgi:large repetitive protein
MDSHIPDEQLDRVFARYLAERGDEIAASTRSGQQAAARVTQREPAWGSLGRLVTIALLAALLAAAFAASTILVGSQPTRPSLPALIPADHGMFTSTGSMAVGREQPSATLLRDGRVLVIGGYRPVALAELWDPDTGEFSPAGTLVHARWAHTATLLADGRVLVVGGVGVPGDGDADGHLTVAELWDPSTLSFSALSSPSQARFTGTAALMPDGRVLISGGSDVSDAGPVPAEVWDPASGAFGPAESLAATVRPDGTLLADGRVLVIDGLVARLWDPATYSYSAAGSLHQARSYGTTSTLLSDGRVLVVGGDDSPGSAEIWDPSTLTFERTGAPLERRSRHTAVLLADGRVLVLGDNFREAGTRSAELFELR